MDKKGLLLDNKGFAITGILYTLLILFLLITVSVLNELRSRNNYLEKASLGFLDDYDGEYVNCPNGNGCLTDNKTNFKGKYVFQIEGVDGLQCYSYLDKGITIDNNVIFTTKECMEATGTRTVTGVYKID